MPQRQNIKTLTKFVEVNGIGVVHMNNGYYQDVEVAGYFIYDRWAFIIHHSTDSPEYFAISEASTGRALTEDVYYGVEDALWYALDVCQRKRIYFATRVSDILVKEQQNLWKSNTTNLRTLAIGTTLWL